MSEMSSNSAKLCPRILQQIWQLYEYNWTATLWTVRRR